jgi:hypothetical protein
VSLTILNAFLTGLPAHELHGLDRAMRFIDDFVIIPGAMGSLFTGLIYSLWTNWGFCTYRWVMVKWAITLFGVFFGTFFLGPWLNGMEEISGRIGDAALADPVYLHNKAMNMWGALLQVTGLAAAVAVSVIKPWGKRKAGGPVN